MFKSDELNNKTNNLEKFRKFCLREFPEFSYAIDQLLNYEDFIDMLKEYSYCESALLKLQDLNEKKEAYHQLKKELKQEMKNYIIRHIKNQTIN